MRKIMDSDISDFRSYLIGEERADATVEKYIRDLGAFAAFLDGAEFDKGEVLAYKSKLMEEYAATSVNSMLASINSYFRFRGWYELIVKNVKIQRQIFVSEEKELSKDEYKRLLRVAKQRDERLFLLMQTICSTGIRVSEVRYITVEAVRRGRADICGKGKYRTAFLPKQLCRILSLYIKKRKIKKGPVFISKNGRPLDRSNIWHEMKSLCKAAGVHEKKVFPHNLRHLFAKTFYSIQNDIIRLADILGHSSVNTTRIYTKESGEIHREKIQKLGLLIC